MLDEQNAHRGNIARHYLEGLRDTALVLPVVLEQVDPVWHLFVVRHPERDRLARQLAEAGIGTMIHYPVPPHLQPAYASLGLAEGDLPVSEALHREVLSLPISPTMTLDNARQVVEVLRHHA